MAGWLPAHGVDALVVQREVLDPAEYVATWLRDAGERGTRLPRARTTRWLAGAGAARASRASGFGFVRGPPHRRADRRLTIAGLAAPGRAAARPASRDWLDRQRWLAAHDDDDALAAATVTLAPTSCRSRSGQPGAEDPEHVVLRQQVGLRRAFASDTATAALVGACDGTLPVGTLVAAVAQVLGDDRTTCGARPPADSGTCSAQVRVLVEAGVLTPSV